MIKNIFSHFISQSIFEKENKVDVQLNNNIVSVTNDVGFETYWL